MKSVMVLAAICVVVWTAALSKNATPKSDMLFVPATSVTVIKKPGKEFHDRIPPGDCNVAHRDIVDANGNIVGCDRRPG